MILISPLSCRARLGLGLLAAWGLLAGESGIAAAKPGDRAGVVAVARGAVTRVAYDVAARNRRGVGKNVSTGQQILLGDVISTGPRGRLQILLLDQTMFTIGPNSRMTIDEFVYNPRNNRGKVSATITQGVFRFISGKIAATQPENVKIKTPVATLAIRGTSIFGIIQPVRRAFLPGRRGRQTAQLPLAGGETIIGVLGGKEGNKDSAIVVTTSQGNVFHITKAGVGVKLDTNTGRFTEVRIDAKTLQTLMQQIGTAAPTGSGGGQQGGGAGGTGPAGNGGNQNGSGSPGTGQGDPVGQANAANDVGADGAGTAVQNLSSTSTVNNITTEASQTATSITTGTTTFGQMQAIGTGKLQGTLVTQLTQVPGSSGTGSATNTATYTINFATRTITIVSTNTNLTTSNLPGPFSGTATFSIDYSGESPTQKAISSGTTTVGAFTFKGTSEFQNTARGIATKVLRSLEYSDSGGTFGVITMKGSSTGTLSPAP